MKIQRKYYYLGNVLIECSPVAIVISAVIKTLPMDNKLFLRHRTYPRNPHCFLANSNLRHDALYKLVHSGQPVRCGAVVNRATCTLLIAPVICNIFLWNCSNRTTFSTSQGECVDILCCWNRKWVK